MLNYSCFCAESYGVQSPWGSFQGFRGLGWEGNFVAFCLAWMLGLNHFLRSTNGFSTFQQLKVILTFRRGLQELRSREKCASQVCSLPRLACSGPQAALREREREAREPERFRDRSQVAMAGLGGPAGIGARSSQSDSPCPW